MRRGFLAAALVACALAPAACASGGGDAERAAEISGAVDTAARYADIHQRSIGLGELSAPVELFELSDLQCPYCRDFTRGALPTIVEQYVRTGKVRLIFHNLPILGEQSARAARLALAISVQNHMFEFIDVFFANQGREGSGYVTDDFLRRIAGAVPGVDVDQAVRDLDHDSVNERLEQARKVAIEFQVRGVPAFLIARTGEELRALHVRRTGDPQGFVDAIESLLAPR
jgi:protein-disulfide isomerase